MNSGTVVGILLLFALVCGLLASMRIFLYRFFDIEWSISTKSGWWVFLACNVFTEEPEPGLLRFLTAEGWIGLLLFLLVGAIGAFVRGDLSPLPWKAFSQGNHWGGGPLFGVAAVALVINAEIWLFFGASQYALWLERHKTDQNPEVVTLKRGITC